MTFGNIDDVSADGSAEFASMLVEGVLPPRLLKRHHLSVEIQRPVLFSEICGESSESGKSTWPNVAVDAVVAVENR